MGDFLAAEGSSPLRCAWVLSPLLAPRLGVPGVLFHNQTKPTPPKTPFCQVGLLQGGRRGATSSPYLLVGARAVRTSGNLTFGSQRVLCNPPSSDSAFFLKRKDTGEAQQ